MTDPRSTTPAPPDTEAAGTTSATPGERRLARPPSERYRTAPPSPAGTEASARTRDTAPDAGRDAGSAGRGVAWAVLAGIVGAAVTTMLGGALAVTAGLIVVAAVIGWGVGQALLTGGGTALHRPGRRWLALGLAIGAVALGQVGLWLYARTQGGVLPPVDFLVETYGPLVPLQAAVAATAAWWAAR